VPLPPILRPVGSDAFHSLLFPTGSAIVAASQCAWRRPDRWWAACIAHQRLRDGLAWERRSSDAMWRGAPNGLQWTVNDWRMQQRSKLVREFGTKPGFDVGFVQGIHARSENIQISHPGDASVMRVASRNQIFPPGYPLALDPQEAVNEMNREWVKKAQIGKNDHPKWRYLLHVDGQTASWGLAHKLNSGSVVLWVESARKHREYYYALLTPWVHYVPVAPDLSDLDSIRAWLDTAEGDARARQMARNAAQLFDTRLRQSDLYCYVYRLLASIKAAQVRGADRADEEFMQRALGPKAFAKFEDARDYAAWKASGWVGF